MARTTNKNSRPRPAAPVPPAVRRGFAATVRDNVDALVFAVLLAMFIRVFVCELFKIPSPSMTPVLLGTEWPRQSVSQYDVDSDGKMDLILKSDYDLGLFQNVGEHYQFAGTFPIDDPVARQWVRNQESRQDRILVGKFLYWFTQPRRGDIVVFRVPASIFEPDKPVYIKRVVGLAGETLAFAPVEGVPGHYNSMGRLMVNGQLVESPPFFKHQIYEYRGIGGISLQDPPACAVYSRTPFGTDIERVNVPANSVYVMGDNTVSSRDSRYWGEVAAERLRGRAIFRFWTKWLLWPAGFNFLDRN